MPRGYPAALALALAALAFAASPAAALPAQTAQITGVASGPPSAPEVPENVQPVAPTATVIAGDPPVTIVDFAFRTPTTTIHVGDTVTWTNQGPTDHTATAADHSFDTGILKKGASASHTFRSAGTFAYICTIHPSMKGGVRVVGAASGAPAPSRASPGASPPAATQADAAPSHSAAPAAVASPHPRAELPPTGAHPALMTAAGLALLSLGLTARRLAT